MITFFYIFLSISFFFFSPSLFFSFRARRVVSWSDIHVHISGCISTRYIKGDMIPATLPVMPISLSLLARYVKEKKGEKRKRNQRNQQLFTFHSKSFILNNIYLLHTCVSVCLCVPDVASRRFSRGARSFHQKVHLRRRRSWFVVRRRLLCFARKTKSNGHHLPAGRCQLCCEAENPNSPSPKGGKTEKKREKKGPHSHALFASTRDEYQ